MSKAYIRPEDLCVCCGSPVPEGMMICWACARQLTSVESITLEEHKEIHRRSGAAGSAADHQRRSNMRNCEHCDNQFSSELRHSPCARCLRHKGMKGYRPMRLRTKFRRWLWRLFG